MKKLLLFAFFLSTVCTNAQFHKAKLLMADGSTKEGLAELPSNQLLDSNIKFKSSEKGSLEKLDHDAVYKILYSSENGTQFLFERTNVVHLYKSFGKEYEHEKANKHWLLLTHANSVIQEYSLAQRYRIDKKGKMLSITGNGSIWYTIYFLLRRPDEDKAYIVSGIGFTNGQVRKAMTIYFKDVPEFVQRIEDKEFKKSSVTDVADAYSKYF